MNGLFLQMFEISAKEKFATGIREKTAGFPFCSVGSCVWVIAAGG
jgi:hypothetical protein